MTDTPQHDTLSWSLDDHIEKLCIRFEDAWKVGRQPSIAEYLGEIPLEGRTDLLRELLKLELDYRLRLGEQLTLDEYQHRFPNDVELLKKVFTNALASPEGTIPHDSLAKLSRPRTANPSRYIIQPQPGLPKMGGQGEVHKAHDPEIGRTVALKRIQNRYTRDDDCRRRFLTEAEITGRLEHPGVVPVYGLVQGEDGEPCYAMRFIEGESLQDAIRRIHSPDPPSRGPDELALALRQLMNRFLTVCNTIAYAHSRGIMHRDLKPANVMLGNYGETLVVDWGLAKPFERDEAARAGGEETLLPTPRSSRSSGETGTDAAFGTRTGAVLGTPAYMSPEQARSERDTIGPASDIFGLGAILYAILAGRAPFDGRRASEAQEKAKRNDFPPPRSVRREVSPTLEAVCLKAMAAEPAGRYSSALALAADVEQWLADEPVTAYAEPLGARLRRRARKHPRLVTAVGLTLVIGSVALGLIAWERERAREKEADALVTVKAARARTRAALDAMVSGVTGDSLTTQKEISAEQKAFLRSVLTYYEEFAAEPGEDRVGRERLAKAHNLLGVIRYRLGHYDEGVPVFRRAAELFRALAADDPAASDYRRELAKSHASLGILLAGLGRWSDAETQYLAALAVQVKLVTDDSAIPDHRRELAGTRNNLGLLISKQQSRHREAEKEYRAALIAFEGLAADHPTEPDYRHGLAQTRTNLGVLLTDLGKLSEAEVEFRAARATFEGLVAGHPAAPEYRLDLAANHGGLGKLFAVRGESERAEAELRAALVLEKALTVNHPTVPEYLNAVAASHNNLGILLAGCGKATESEAEFRAALAERKRLAAGHPTAPEYLRNLASSHNSLGYLLNYLDKRSEAEAEYRSGVAVGEKLVANSPARSDYAIELGGGYCNLGNLLRARGHAATALDWHTKAVDRLAAVADAEPASDAARQFLRNSHCGRAEDLTRLNRYADALADWERALGLDDGSARDKLRLGRADALARLGRAAEAAAQADELAAEPKATADTLYDCACVLALGSGAANNPDARSHAARAVAALRHAVAKGYRDIQHMLNDADLAALRSRDDYAALLWDLADGIGPTTSWAGAAP